MKQPAKKKPKRIRTAAEDTFTIGQLASDLHITARAIRFYESKGLIRPQRRGSQRAYSKNDRQRLDRILRAKSIGWSLEHIGRHLKLLDDDPTYPTQVREQILLIEVRIDELGSKLDAIQKTLTELKQRREALARKLDRRTGP
jgi:DNA-binding transcriptional MerR regulator